jgi:hypothetical protein
MEINSRKCPHCGTYDIIPVDTTGGKILHVNLTCGICGTSWINQYVLERQFIIEGNHVN